MTLLLDPPQWIQLLMVFFGAWRVSILLVLEGGPGGVVRWLRSLMGILHDDDGVAFSYPTHLPGSLFACVWCLSFWTTLALYGILWVAPIVVMVIGTWGVATYLEALRNALADRR